MRYASLRRFARSLPEVTEEPHHRLGSFRVRGRIFVTVLPDQAHIHVFVSGQPREQALAMYPHFIEKLTWGGKVVGVRISLARALPHAVKALVRLAWQDKAPRTRRPTSLLHVQGDRRSIRGVPTVVKRVLADPRLLPYLLDGMSDPDPLIRMRCADATEKIGAVRPECLAPYKKRLMKLAEVSEQQEVRWHLAQLLSRLKLNRLERRRAVDTMTVYLRDRSRIVKTFSMQALADIAAQDAELRPSIVRQLRKHTRTGSPAMKSRGRRLLERLQQ